MVSCHPGWVATPGVAEAYGEAGARLLAPLRTVREGAEGVAWLVAAPPERIVGGAFYLDRAPSPKHLSPSWLFNRSGQFTKNNEKEVDELLTSLALRTGADAGLFCPGK